jgi:CheY-like chemotaxis protein
VLVIDDDPTARGLLRRMLAKEGFEVREAASGAEGLAQARAARPDVITLDVLMPDLDGWTVLTQLKADPDLCTIPVVMTTILDEPRRGFALGAADYLTKPIDRDRLLQALRRYRRAAEEPGMVLVIDDDAATRATLRRALEPEGWTVREAPHGRAALAALGPEEPDLILLDLLMPEMDGFAFLDAFRSRPDRSGTPVVILTAKDLTDADRARLNGGVEHILHKGAFDAADLVEKIRRYAAAGATP